MKHAVCPSLEVLATRFDAHVALTEERRKNDEERRVDVSESLKLQAREYERRLGELNHAHSMAEKKNQEYISREVFYAAIREATLKIEALQRIVYIGLGILMAAQLVVTLYFGRVT